MSETNQDAMSPAHAPVRPLQRARTSGTSLPNATAPVPVTVHGVRPAGTLTRREAMQWVLGAVAAAQLPGLSPVFGQEVGRIPQPQEKAATQPNPVVGQGYGTDPNLVRLHKPGDLWPLTFTPAQKRAAAALADAIFPADHLGPAASTVGVVEVLDEWVSAPYPQQRTDRPIVLKGLAWIDAESAKRFGGKPFADVDAKQRNAICDDICRAETTDAQFRHEVRFFNRFRALCAGAYYATPAGWKAIGYEGNVALPSFDGPPPAVLAKLGVTQTVG